MKVGVRELGTSSIVLTGSFGRVNGRIDGDG
jgi:polyisoprenoid-binding protein YceI